MANTLGNYNPVFFAQNALQQLYQTLGMGARVHRGAEQERNSTGKKLGQMIEIRRPSKFVAKKFEPGTGTADQDVVGQNVQITLATHKEVKFTVTDEQLAWTGERIIEEHIRPAADAIANAVDQDIHALGAKVGPKAIVGGADDTVPSYITRPRKVLRGNLTPTNSNLHFAIDTGMEAYFLESPIFHEAQVAGDGENKAALLAGSLGNRFGVELFVTQLADVEVAAVSADDLDDLEWAVNNTNGYTANHDTTMAIDGGGSKDLKAGDTFKIANDETTYILTADATVANNAANISFYPLLRKNVADDDVVTFNQRDAVEKAAHYRNLMFHRDAFACAFATLPMTGDGKGATIDTVTDEQTGMSIRARMFYSGDAAEYSVALDVMYGVQVLDPRLAVRCLRAQTVHPAE